MSFPAAAFATQNTSNFQTQVVQTRNPGNVTVAFEPVLGYVVEGQTLPLSVDVSGAPADIASPALIPQQGCMRS